MEGTHMLKTLRIPGDPAFPNRARLRYPGYDGRTGEYKMITREFHAPREGGYVREGDKQVCEKLARLGSTLYWRPEVHGDLINLIRRERRKMLRAERAFERSVMEG
jgi:hypothetical protein